MKTTFVKNSDKGHDKRSPNAGSWLPKGYPESARPLCTAFVTIILQAYYIYSNSRFPSR